MGTLVIIAVVSLLLGFGFAFLSVRSSLLSLEDNGCDEDKPLSKYVGKVLGQWFASTLFFVIAGGFGIAILVKIVADIF